MCDEGGKQVRGELSLEGRKRPEPGSEEKDLQADSKFRKGMGVGMQVV